MHNNSTALSQLQSDAEALEAKHSLDMRIARAEYRANMITRSKVQHLADDADIDADKLSVDAIKKLVAEKLGLSLSHRIRMTATIAELTSNPLSDYFDLSVALRATDMLHKLYGDYAPIDTRNLHLIADGVDASELAAQFARDY